MKRLMILLLFVILSSARIWACGHVNWPLRYDILSANLIAEIAVSSVQPIDNTPFIYQMSAINIFEGEKIIGSRNFAYTGSYRSDGLQNELKPESRLIIIAYADPENKKYIRILEAFIFGGSNRNNLTLDEFDIFLTYIKEMAAIKPYKDSKQGREEQINWLMDGINSGSSHLRHEALRDLCGFLGYKDYMQQKSKYSDSDPPNGLYFLIDSYLSTAIKDRIYKSMQSNKELNFCKITLASYVKMPMLDIWLRDRLQQNIYDNKELKIISYENFVIEEFLYDTLKGNDRFYLGQMILFEIKKLYKVNSDPYDFDGIPERMAKVSEIINNDDCRYLHAEIERLNSFWISDNEEKYEALITEFIRIAEPHLDMCHAEKLAEEYYSDDPWYCFENKALNFKEESGSDLYIEKVFPNPTSGKVVVHYELQRDGNLSVELLDITGQRIMANLYSGFLYAGKNRLELYLPQVSNGVYFLRLGFGDTNLTKRVLVSR